MLDGKIDLAHRYYSRKGRETVLIVPKKEIIEMPDPLADIRLIRETTHASKRS